MEICPAPMQRPRKFVICNGDEGDPGPFMDRAALRRRSPYPCWKEWPSPLAWGQPGVTSMCAPEYPLAIESLERRNQQARQMGSWEEHFGDRLRIRSWIERMGAGAFVCGRRRAHCFIEGSGDCPAPRPLPGQARASGSNRPSSTTWKPWPTSATSSSTAGNGLPPSARPPAKEPRSRLSQK